MAPYGIPYLDLDLDCGGEESSVARHDEITALA